ncbi:MAG: glycosyltransferase, partial [bacterium]
MAAAGTIKVLIAGGGTGGHLYPGIALAQEFQKRRQTKIMFLGTSHGIEQKVVPQTPYEFKKIWMRGLQRKMAFSNVIFPIRLFVSLAQCAYLILRFKPDVIIGTGGYVSGPALMMGLAFAIPTVIQEQNSFPGLVNRLLGNWVKQVHLTYEASLTYFKRQEDIFISGNPVRGEVNKMDKNLALQKLHLHADKTTLFIFGGSQGAHAINQQVLHSLPALLQLTDLQILWATGAADFELVQSSCQSIKDRVKIYAYIEDMASAYAAADMVLCRAGASTLSEIAL